MTQLMILIFLMPIVLLEATHTNMQYIDTKNHEENTVVIFEWRTNITKKLRWEITHESQWRNMWCVFPLLITDLDADKQREIIVATNSSILCVDGASGAIEWNKSINLSYRFHTVHSDIHVLYIPDTTQLIVANSKRVVSIEASCGETLWSTTLRDEVCSLYFLNGAIIVATHTSVALIDEGEVLWEYIFPESIRVLLEPTHNVIVICCSKKFVVINQEGEKIKELSLEAKCVQENIILYDLDMDGEPEILIPLKNKKVVVLGLDTLAVEYTLTLPRVVCSISVGALNPNNIADFVFFLGGGEAMVWLDFSYIFPISLRHGQYMLIWDLNNDGWGDIVAGSSEWMEMDILLSPGILINFTWHGWDVVGHFFDKMYIVDILGNFVLDIILSQQLIPNDGWITCIDGEYILGEPPTYTFAPVDRALDSYLILRPPILIDDIDADGILEIVTTFHTKESPPTYGIEAYEIKDTTHTYTGIICGETFIQMRNDADLDFLPDTIEIEIGTNTTMRDTDNDVLPDGWEYMNKLNPLDPQDAILDNDNDGLDNIAEYEYGGDPWDSDTDDDGLSDYDEARIGTDLRLNDTDGDGYSDSYEVSHGTDPLDPDDYPAPFVVGFWWILMIVIAIIIVLLVFLYRWVLRREV